MLDPLPYDGQRLHWRGKGRFRATSGMPGFQSPHSQCVQDRGPVPEGRYDLLLREDPSDARDDGTGTCNLEASRLLQRIPRGSSAGPCEPYWANGGHNRIRLTPADVATRAKCRGRRGGFYLHDSTKGYSHGCIEVEARSFTVLREFISVAHERSLTLRVRYVPTRPTYGGTATSAG
jgi:hypothetical protein